MTKLSGKYAPVVGLLVGAALGIYGAIQEQRMKSALPPMYMILIGTVLGFVAGCVVWAIDHLRSNA